MYHTCKYRSFLIESKSTRVIFFTLLFKTSTVHCFFNLTKRFVLSNSFVNLATVFVKVTSRSIPLLCSWIKGCEYCECLYFYNYYPYRIVSKITISSPFVSIRIVSCDDRIVSSLVWTVLNFFMFYSVPLYALCSLYLYKTNVVFEQLCN